MSVASEITRINNNIASAYTQVSAKGGTLPATQNSANLATAIASISGGGSSGLEYEEGIFEPTDTVSRPTIDFDEIHTKVPVYVAICDVTPNSISGSNLCVVWSYFGNYDLFNGTLPGTNTNVRYYGATFGRYLKSGTTFSVGGQVFQNPSSDPTDTSANYIRYHVTESYFKPGIVGSTNTSFLQNRTYKWIAVWI